MHSPLKEIPAAFICPLCKKILDDAVKMPGDVQSYDRSCLRTMFEAKGQSLRAESVLCLESDRPLVKAIREWHSKQPRLPSFPQTPLDTGPSSYAATAAASPSFAAPSSAAAAAAPPFLVPPSFPIIPRKDLAFEKEIVRSEFASVSQGKWISLGVSVAIKQIGDGKEFSLKAQDDLGGEAQILGGLRHPNIIVLYGLVTEVPQCIVMEWGERSLYDLLSSSEEIRWQRRHYYARDMVSGLKYLHDNGILHRNLKSANVFVQKNSAKLADFGLAKKSQSVHTVKCYAGSVLVDNSPWAAPELQTDALPVFDRRTDMYAYAMTLWEMAARDIPFKGEERQVLIAKFVESEGVKPRPPFPSKLKQGTVFQQIMEECWISPAVERPSADSVLKRLLKEIADFEAKNEVKVPKCVLQ